MGEPDYTEIVNQLWADWTSDDNPPHTFEELIARSMYARGKAAGAAEEKNRCVVIARRTIEGQDREAKRYQIADSVAWALLCTCDVEGGAPHCHAKDCSVASGAAPPQESAQPSRKQETLDLLASTGPLEHGSVLAQPANEPILQCSGCGGNCRRCAEALGMPPPEHVRKLEEKLAAVLAGVTSTQIELSDDFAEKVGAAAAEITVSVPAQPIDPEADKLVDGLLAKARTQRKESREARNARLAEESAKFADYVNNTEDGQRLKALANESDDFDLACVGEAPGLSEEQIAKMVADADSYAANAGTLEEHVRALAAEVRRLRKELGL